MRMAMFILVLAAIATGLVAIRKDELVTNHQTRRLQARLYEQDKELSRQKAERAYLKAPQAVRRRAVEQGVALDPPDAPARVGRSGY